MTDEIMHRREETALERYQRDNRFRAQVQAIVSHVLNDHGRVDPERADRDAGDIATRVAALVLEHVFANDAELNSQRALAEHYRKIAEDALAIMPMRQTIMTPAPGFPFTV